MTFVRPPDDYERQYMPTGNDVLYRDKAVAPRWLLGIGLAALVGVAAALPFLAVPWWASLAVLGVGGAGIVGNLLLWIIRTTVTSEKLVVHYGFLREEIPLDRVEECTATDLPLIRRWHVGWGIGLRGSYFTVGTSRGVKVRFRTESGRLRTLWLSSGDPEALAQAVSSARSGRARVDAPPARVRVDAGVAPEADAESDEQLATEAEQESAKRARED